MALCSGLKNGDAFVSLDGYLLQDSNGLYLSILSAVDKRKIIINNVVYRAIVNLDIKEGE